MKGAHHQPDFEIMKFAASCKLLSGLALIVSCAIPAAATAAQQTAFETADAAVAALLTALEADDDEALVAIFGEQHKRLVVPADKAANSANRAKTVAALRTYRLLDEQGTGRRILLVGDQAWPFPIPLVRDGGQWRFATEEGEDEIVNRRVGANERSAILVLNAYLDAQKQYAGRDRDGDGVLQYAQRLGSRPGRQDGLYWPADASRGEETSPFGPLIAESAAYLRGHGSGDAYRGYHFRILTRQGKSAPGGAYSYVINGRMIAGFAMVAYPAQYGESGVMTFIVNHNGKIFEKDLGTDSTALGAKLTAFDPGTGWKEITAQ